MRGVILGRRFEILERAGAGAVGTVYRGRDRRTGAPVALKLLHDLSDVATARFTDEVRVLQTLAHPAIVALLGYGRVEQAPSDEGSGAPWMAMEWIEGGDLASALARGWEPTVEEALTLARRVGEALGAAHRAGIIHRDVKPANIMLPGGRPEQAKLVDFGIAAARAEDLTLPGAAVVVGTPDYMAPEQAHGDGTLDARADVYALASVLFECLTSTPPFQGERGLGILAQKLFDEAPRANELLADFDRLPEALDDLIARALARDRSVRPQDGDAFVNALDAVSGAGRTASPTRGELRTLTSRERRALAVLAIRVPPEAGTRALRATMDGSGFRMEPLNPGLWVAALHAVPGAGSLAEAALAAARSLIRALPDTRVAVALGRGEISASGWAGEPFARAVELVELLANSPTEDRVMLDPTTEAALMDASRRPATCVGRERELAILRTRTSQAVAEGRPQVEVVLGGPGTGKSTLVRTWLADRARAGLSAPVLRLRGRQREAQTPYAALAQAILAWAGAQAGALITRRRRALRARLEELGGRAESETLAPWLGELAGLDYPARGQAALEAARRTPSLMLTRTAEALGRWIDLLGQAGTAESGRLPPGEPGPTTRLVIVEDGHWVDGATLQVLEEMLRLARRSTAVVLVARPSLMRRSEALWASELASPPIQLGPLPADAASALVQATWEEFHRRRNERPESARALDGTAERRVVERAEGNPLLIVELTRWIAAGNPPEGAPETALDLAAARLAGLTADERRALRAASVFGRRFSEGGVAALLGGPEELASVRRWLHTARKKHLVQVVAAPPDGGRGAGPWYEMTSALLAEAAYDTLPAEDRMAGHGMALAWLRAQGSQDGALLGRHALAAGAWEDAATYFLSAANRAARVGDEDAARELLASYEQALEQGSVPLGAPARAETWALEGELALAAGDVEEAAASARATVDTARRGGARALLARGLLTLGRAHLGAGAWRAAAEVLGEAWQVAGTLDDTAVTAQVALSLGAVYAAGDPRQSLAAYDQAMRAFERLGETMGVAASLRGVAEVALRWGDPEAATLHAREALALLRPLGARREVVLVLSTLGESLVASGRPEEAREVLHEAGEESSMLAPKALIRSQLARGRALLRLGAYDEARADFESVTAGAAVGELHGARLEAHAGLACCARATAGAGATWSRALTLSLELAEEWGLPPGPAADLLMMATRDLDTPLARQAQRLVARTQSSTSTRDNG